MIFPDLRNRKKVLIVGPGAREHALAWKIAQSPWVAQIFVAPGNAGTAVEARTGNVSIGPTDTKELVKFAKRYEIDLTVVGPEAPLVAGIADAFQAAGLRIFGPTRAAAMITEGSKCRAKEFMQRHGIPTAPFRCFAEYQYAEPYILEHPLPVVVKADGLAAGKGVTVAESHDDALEAAKRCFTQHKEIVVEEYLDGEEVSFTCLVVENQPYPFPPSQDSKRLEDGDRGPMTGGMGAYSPVPIVNPELDRRIMRRIVAPTLAGLAREGISYTGFLYVGLMIVNGNPYVLEYNCRLGDPEAEVLLARLHSDLYTMLADAANGRRPSRPVWRTEAALGIVLAAAGYPGTPRRGDPIYGLERRTGGVIVFHAGTAFERRQPITAGGRVLVVVGLGKTISEAHSRAYAHAKKIRFDGMHYRRDIGWRALKHEHEEALRHNPGQ